MRVRVLSLFSGGGGGDLGLERAGCEIVALCEIEPHARAVLRHRHPDTPILGDVREVRGSDYPDLDLVVGGSPCQDLSVAGKRAGLDGARSGLFFEQIRVWEESGAPHILWENVVGALSSNAGRDFACVLGAIVGAPVPVPADGWGGAGVVAGPTGVAAWRVLDLQWFGPPQRRRRVFVLGSRAGGVDPAEVLLEPEGVRGDSPPRRDAGKGAPARAGGGAARGGGVVAFDWQAGGSGDTSFRGKSRSYVVRAGEYTGALQAVKRDAILAFHHTQDPISGPSAPRHGAEGMGVLAFDTTQITSPTNRCQPRADGTDRPLAASAHPPTICITGDRTHALTSEGADASEDGTGRGTPIVASETGQGWWSDGPACATLRADPGGMPSHVVAPALTARVGKGPDSDGSHVIAALDARAAGGGFPGTDGACDGHVQATAGRPRRLTPRECERLMGWEDDWTRWGVDEKGRRYELADGPRYRICGNGIGAPHTAWIGARFVAACEAMREEAAV